MELDEAIKEVIERYPTLSKKEFNDENDNIKLGKKEAEAFLKYLFENMKLNKTSDVEIYELDRISIKSILDIVTKQEKMMNLMTNFIYHIGYYEDSYGNSCAIIQDSCFKNKTTESCKECIKQYFEKKAEESE